MLTIEETLNSEVPQARYLVLELAGLLDRLDDAAMRDNRSVATDTRIRTLHRVLELLCADGMTNRAEQVLRTYSEIEPPTPASQR